VQRSQTFFGGEDSGEKKEEFSDFMENMPPENSFPQICVVSVNESVGNVLFPPEHIGSVALSNLT
jgi:hypothetical protein